MGRDIFTSYIICNRLNLKTFFEPIIYFIEIGKSRELPLWEPYMRISFRTAQTKTTQILARMDMCNKKFETYLSFLLWFTLSFSLKIRKNKNLKALLCGYNAKKYQVGSFVFMLIVTGLLNPLFTYFFFFIFFYLLFLFVCNAVLLLFSLLLIGILLLRPYESIKTSDSYYNHDDSRKPSN